VLVDRTRRELSDEGVQKIADTYHAWRGDIGRGAIHRAHHESPERAANVAAQFIAPNSHDDHHGRDESGPYEDIPGFCKSASMDNIRKHGHVPRPGRYVGAAEQEDDGEPFEKKMLRLSALWREQRATATKLDAAIEANLKELGYGE
jgi:type I restriction enzyme M protein